jgi:hypothetical protein
MGHDTIDTENDSRGGLYANTDSTSAPAATPDHGAKAPMNSRDEPPVEGDSSSESAKHNTKADREGSEDQSDSDDVSKRPPLPLRPSTARGDGRPSTPRGPLSPSSQRPQLQSKPTTAISSVDIQTVSFPDGSRETYPTNSNRYAAAKEPPGTPSRKPSRTNSEGDESGSLMSPAPTFRATGDLESLLGDSLTAQSPAWRMLSTQADSVNPFESVEFDFDDNLSTFQQEFDEIAEVDTKTGNEGTLIWESCR